VAEFNTYDILKQRYLLLTREALAVLKERVQQQVARRPERVATAAAAGAAPAAQEG
jgi:large subunit ribosomal protein L4